ncbi:MAG TPA: hypothetical protein ACFYED_03845 [Candidatus Tripitaka californicus]|uniref:hypothetical protein n=1 Tax=Candidatus Tripitaka californicus TaxID=3367616 RepID=UPI00402880D1|nr:hypothetical protein [Planctomycetota bacterium]
MAPVILEMKKKGGRVETICELEVALQTFSEAVEAHEYLEIDGDVEGDGLSTHCLTVLDHEKKVAHNITLEAILTQELDALIKALETGVKNPLYGVTRIVGYYSRISNWNKSKLGELRDRHKGNYSVKAVA